MSLLQMPGTGLTAGALCIAFAVGFGAAWTAQGWRYGEAAANVESDELRAAKSALERQIETSNSLRASSDAARRELIEYKKGALSEIDSLERRVRAGPERVWIKATCPAPSDVPGAAANASGAGAGAAILAPDVAQDLFSFERAYVDQFAKYKQCWRELKKLSKK